MLTINRDALDDRRATGCDCGRELALQLKPASLFHSVSPATPKELRGAFSNTSSSLVHPHSVQGRYCSFKRF